jgi:uncharacterized protein
VSILKSIRFAALVLALGACSPQQAATAPAPAETARHSVSGLEVAPLTVTVAGKPHRFMVELARSDTEQTRGLMFRTKLGADEGMLFPYRQPRLLSFWMRNTVIPLDIIFIGPDRRILNIEANTTPYSETPVLSVAPAAAVLELNGGRAAELGIVPGAKVDW